MFVPDTEILLKNSSLLKGKWVRESDTQVVIELEEGTISFHRDEIATIHRF